MTATAPIALMRLGHGSGSPAGLPDFRPMNPGGRPMPKPVRKPVPRMHQIFVEQPGGAMLAIGPKAAAEFLEPLLLNINRLVSLGQASGWGTAHLLPAEAPDRLHSTTVARRRPSLLTE